MRSDVPLSPHRAEQGPHEPTTKLYCPQAAVLQESATHNTLVPGVVHSTTVTAAAHDAMVTAAAHNAMVTGAIHKVGMQYLQVSTQARRPTTVVKIDATTQGKMLYFAVAVVCCMHWSQSHQMHTKTCSSSSSIKAMMTLMSPALLVQALPIVQLKQA